MAIRIAVIHKIEQTILFCWAMMSLKGCLQVSLKMPINTPK